MWKRSPRSRQHSVNNQNTHGEASGNTGRKERVYFYLDMRFWFWTGLLVAGFAYVAFVLCDRSVPLQSRDGGYAEVIKLLLSAPLLYMLGVRRTLEPFDSDWRSVVVRNVIGFALPFFVALHWYYLQSIPQLNYSLTLKGLQTMHPIGQLVFLAGGLLVAGLVVYHLVLARREGYRPHWSVRWESWQSFRWCCRNSIQCTFTTTSCSGSSFPSRGSETPYPWCARRCVPADTLKGSASGGWPPCGIPGRGGRRGILAASMA